MSVPANVIVAWPSTAASIPAGWTRETNLDAQYVQGAGTGADADLTTARGNASHSHTSPSHTPLQNSHVHSFTATSGPDTIVNTKSTGTAFSTGTHTHVAANSNSTTATNNGIAITVNTTNNDLAFKTVIFIKSDGTPSGIPVGAYAFFESDTLPSGWGSRLLGDTYLKGAAAAGDGGATGGSNSHTHTSPAHTHTQNSHTHTGTSGAPSATVGTSGASTTQPGPAHTHSVSFAASTAVNQSVTTTISTDAHDPVFKKLNIIANGNASADLPAQIIAMWGGTNASIPANWTRYTGMDGYFLKGANAPGESGVTTGGSLTHTHTASDCQPVQNSHTHAITDNGTTNTVARSTATPTVSVGASGHLHTTWNDAGATATNQTTAVSINVSTSEAAYPPYRRVIFIQFSGVTPPVVPRACYTSYDLNIFDIGSPYAAVSDETAARVRAGDQRFMKRY